MGTLILVRHGQSEWNLKNLFTGWENPPLTPKGCEEAQHTGQKLQQRGFHITRSFCSLLQRAQQTCAYILQAMGQEDVSITYNQALNERNYGQLTGLNKDVASEKWGAEQIKLWRRSYDIAPPGGESLRDTGARVWPYYVRHIQPYVLRRETVLVVAHGNSLRALMMLIEGLSPEEIVHKEIPTASALLYKLNPDSTLVSKDSL